jgi:ATP-dependent DNA helicase RecQ
MVSLKSALQQYFGYSSFHPLQEGIINDILAKKDVFILMPTGGGKSLCYQLPSVIQNGTTIVISPLISLMKDQVDALVQNEIKAAYLNSSLLPHEQRRVLKQLENNELSLLYVAPERLVQDSFLQTLQTVAINFFAIDEAHCISQWGHDFRPEYRQLDCIREFFPDKPLVALTATATPLVKKDIIERLNLKNPQIYQASFDRPNLFYRLIPKYDSFTQAYEYITNRPGESGIIYCQSRKRVDSVAERLQSRGIQALPYHAGLSDDVRKQNQERFIREDVDVIVATIAFGMGINKPNVRYIIHYDLPKTLEHYYQETGRAGRDGLPSECLLLYSYGDKFFYDRFIDEKQTEEERSIAKAQLHRMIDYAQSKICRRALLLQYFAEPFMKQRCDACDNCLSPQETFDGTIVAQKILSCVYRTGQRFGVSHIVRVLTGSQEKNVLRYKHNLLSTYGIMQDYDQSSIKTFIYELIQQGYLKQTEDQYGILSLTAKSSGVLKGKEKVSLIKPRERVIHTREKAEELQGNTDLFSRLRLLRKQMADEQNVPPYVIFSDASLKDMATYFPQTKEQFFEMHGVGEEKLKKYGQLFLDEIISYCKPLDIDPIPKKPSREKKTSTVGSDTVAITLELFHQGKTVAEIAKQRGFTEETIHKHLQQAYLKGASIDIATFVSSAKQKAIIIAFDRLGIERLAPIKEFLGENYSYLELRWVQTKLLKDQANVVRSS